MFDDVAVIESPITLEFARSTFIEPEARWRRDLDKFPERITLFDLLAMEVGRLGFSGREPRLFRECNADYLYQVVQLPIFIGRPGFGRNTESRINDRLRGFRLTRGMTVEPALVTALEEHIAARSHKHPMSPEDIGVEDGRLIARERDLEAQLLSVRAMRAALGTVPLDTLPAPLPERAQKAFDIMRARLEG